MGRLDRYILMTAGGAFLAVLVVLTSMVWLTTALRRFELLTSQGQTFWVFLTITGLSLPTLMVVIAPVALFLAVVYTLYKLNSDSELVAISAAGVSPWHVLRAPLLLSVVVALVTVAISADLSPRSLRALGDRLSLVNADIVTNVAAPGRFTSIERGLTFHVRERAPGGVMLGIFINDERDPAQATTYLADRGRIIPSGPALILVLEQGTIHRAGSGGRGASIVEFERYGFDLSQFDPTISASRDRASFRNLVELMWPATDDAAFAADPGQFRVELHRRLSAPLYPIAAFVIAFAFLGGPRTTRQSRGLSIAGAVVAFTAVEIVGLGSEGLLKRSVLALPLPYLAPLAGIGLGALAIFGNVEARMPASLQRLADAIAARAARLDTA